ncbi:hypothetical protein EXIGLDRAFT_777508 [Exidia glandulosa HHB12029]|uniref:Uncharacterized protein n=1 Tax=Exidia glandulosa HHB12029 TaxID=1314781 RepID=A0A165CZL9_EXIGL|nr:hypothetical protein EXIGLDRAFT_777508 [Exidia glandulosa HHB12029]
MEPPYSLKYLNTLDRLALVKLCKSHNIIYKGASDALKLRLADLGKLTVRGKGAGRQTTSTASKRRSTRASSTRMKTRNARAVEEHDTTSLLPSTHSEQPQLEPSSSRSVGNKPQLCARTPSSKVARLAATSPISTAKRHTRASSSRNDTESPSTVGSQRRRQSLPPVVRSDSQENSASTASSSGRDKQHVFEEIELDILNTIEDVPPVSQRPPPPDTTHPSAVANSALQRPHSHALGSSLSATACDDSALPDVDSGQIVGSCALGYTQPPLSFCRGETNVAQASQPDFSTPADPPVLVETACDTQMDTIMADDESVEPESEDDDDMELIIGHPRAVTPTLTYMVDPPPPPPKPTRLPPKPDSPVFTYTLRTRASYRPLVRLPRKYPLAQLPKYRRLERERKPGGSSKVVSRVYCLARNEKGVRGETQLSLARAPWLDPSRSRRT